MEAGRAAWKAALRGGAEAKSLFRNNRERIPSFDS